VLYAQVLEDELGALERRMAPPTGETLADLEAQLQGLYANQGSDWLGRGVVGDITLGATIAAYEVFIATSKGASAAPFPPAAGPALHP
jgi:hypothetical protein